MTASIDWRHERQEAACCPRGARRMVPACVRAGLLIIGAAALSAPALAQSLALKTCTRTFGTWIEARDASLKRLDVKPTVLGLDNTWCAASPARVADLRAELARVRQVCGGLSDAERQRTDTLIARAALQLDRVQVCPAPAAVVTAAEALPWRTSVREAPVPQPPAKETPKKVQMHTAAAPEPQPEPRAKVVPEPRAKVVAEPRAKVVAEPQVKADAEPSVEADAEQRTKVVAAAVMEPPPGRDITTGSLPGEAPPKEPKPSDVAQGAPPEAKPDVAKKAAPPASAPVEDDECLVVTRTSLATYLIENKNCQPQSILTAIELPRPGQAVRCFTKKVASQIAIAGEYGVAPQINFQCREGRDGCGEDMLRGMFPECQPG